VLRPGCAFLHKGINYNLKEKNVFLKGNYYFLDVEALTRLNLGFMQQ
jgi:hypothetical protein